MEKKINTIVWKKLVVFVEGKVSKILPFFFLLNPKLYNQPCLQQKG